MNPDELKKHIAWLHHEDIRDFLACDDVPSPWFPAYRYRKSADQNISLYSALVPLAAIPRLLNRTGDWDLRLGDGGPAIWSGYADGKQQSTYVSLGTENGVEPIVLHRSFHGMRGGFMELAQEFRLYHNLFPESSKKRFLLIDDNGEESEAARYGEDFFEIRTDLVLKFCAIKQMALAIYVDSVRYSKCTLAELGLQDTRNHYDGPQHGYHLAIIPENVVFKKDFETSGSIHGKKYVMPGPMPEDVDRITEEYQDFIIDTDGTGKPIRHTCDPNKLFDTFGKNPDAAHELTPVFFRAEVLAKYYADPTKFSVEDGFLRCRGLWGLHMDNDHLDYVVVFLCDLGRDLSAAERNYWLSFNIPPDGRKISETAYRRGFLAEFTDPQKPDLLFKHEYNYFNRNFREANGWDFFLPLHDDDEHFLTTLRLLWKDNQAEFDSQLIALTKLLVDSLNEKEIAKGLTTLVEKDKGITKLEKFFVERGAAGYEPHVKFLRVLQDLRSKSAAHRKGSSYEKLIEVLQMADEGQQKVFMALLVAGTEFIRFLKAMLIPKEAD